MSNIISFFVKFYPLWIVSSSVLGYFYPSSFLWFSGNYMVMALAIVMLGMGLTLNLEDFGEILDIPGAVILVAFLQFSIMPLTAWGISQLFHLSPDLAIGLIIVGCCPGGTASNVIVYLAKGHLALSIIMTTLSTILAIVATPLLTEFFAGSYVPVDAWGLFFTTIKVVLLPVGLGVFLNYKFPTKIKTIASVGPLVSVIAIVFIAGSIVAQSAETVAEYALSLLGAASLLHATGFLFGYVISKILGFRKVITVTASVEVGMQNGGLAAVLANKHFTLQPLAAVPAVFSSVMQTIIGGLLAGWWRSRSKENIVKLVKRNILDSHTDKIKV